MNEKIKRWLEPPQFEGDEEKTSQTRIANTLMLYLGVALLIVILVLIPLFAYQKIGSWIVSLTMFIGLGIGRHLIFQGRFQLGGTLIFTFIYLCILAMLILSGGASGTAMFYFATIVLIAGFFMDARIVNGLTVATFLIAMSISFLQEHGWVDIPQVFVFNSFFSWVATGIGLVFMIRTRELFVGNLKNAVANAHQQNAASQKAESRFRAVVEHSRNGVVFMGADRKINYISPSYQQLVGFNPQEMIGHIGAEYIYPQDREFAAKKMSELLQTPGGTVVAEYRLLRRDGSLCWIETTAVNLLDDPNVQALVLSQRDINERKHAEIHNRLIAEVQDFLLRPCTLQDIYRLVSEKAQELIGDGITATAILDETRNTLRMGAYHGIDIPFEKVLSILGFDPWQKEFTLDAMADEGLNVYRNSRLSILEGGLYALTAQLLPQSACLLIEKLLRVQKIYGVGFVHKDAHLGGLVILARSDITPHIAILEQMVNLATIAIERKRAEEALRENEAKLSAILENSRDAVGVHINGIWEMCNPAALKLFGVASPAELIGTPILNVIAPNERTRINGYVRNRMEESDAPLGYVTRGLRTDGTEFDMDVRLSSFVLKDKRNVLVILRDITERKRAEEMLRQQNQVLIALQNTTLELVSQLDLKTLLENIVKRAGALVGTSAGFIDLVDPVTNQLIPQVGVGALEESLQLPVQPGEGLTGTVWQTGEMLIIPNYDEWAGRLGKFSPRTLSSVIGLPLVSEAKVIGVLGLGSAYGSPHHFDSAAIEVLNQFARLATVAVQNARLFSNLQAELSERKRADQALQESEERFRAVVQTANDAIITMNTQGNIVSWNAAAETIFGFSKNEIVGKPVTQIVPEQFQERQRQSIERALASNERKIMGRTIEVAGLGKDGKQFPIEMSLAEWKTQAGNFFTAIIRDVRERKQAEEHIRQSEKKYRELFQVNKDGIAIFMINPDGSPSHFVEFNTAAHTMLGYTREEMLQLTPLMLEPETTGAQAQARTLEFQTRGTANFETVLTHKNGQRVFAEFTAQLIQYENQPAIMNIVRDVTERKQHEKELHVIAALSAALRSAPTRAEMLPVIVEQMVALLNCQNAAIEMIDPPTGDSITEAAHGVWQAHIGARQKSGTGINAFISQTRQPYSTNDLKNDPNLAYPEWIHQDIHGGIGAPLIAQDQLIGFVWIARTSAISESDVRLLAAVADIAANALYRATLHEQTQKDATDLALAYDTTLEGWAHALELRDQETEGHTRRVAQMTVDLARILGIGEAELESVRRGALLHDIGKMGIPDSVLLKPGTLNDREWEIMRRHPEYAYQLLEPIDYLHPAIDIPYCHHEQWDGSGYPRGLRGEEIPLQARIFAIVDVWDALTSDRPYRKAWSVSKTRQHIQALSGKHFDPRVVAEFLKIVAAN